MLTYCFESSHVPRTLAKCKRNDLAVVDTDGCEALVKSAVSRGVYVYGYLNIGALEDGRSYYQKFKSLRLAYYDGWDGEYWVDVTDKGWQEHILDLAKKIKATGAIGLYLDNTDIYYRCVYEEDRLAKAGKILLGGADADNASVLRSTIETLASTMEDADVVDSPAQFLFPSFDGNGHFYNAGERILYGGTLYKVLQAHSSQADWTPDATPALFARVLAGQDGTDIGVWEQPDSTNGYMIGDKVHYPTASDPVYECTIDNNVWSPAAYPAGWKVLGDN